MQMVVPEIKVRLWDRREVCLQQPLLLMQTAVDVTEPELHLDLEERHPIATCGAMVRAMPTLLIYARELIL